jgi:hypothetical protein
MPSIMIFAVTVTLLFVAILACLEIGWRIRRFGGREDGEGSGLAAIDGAVFGLMGLLIAFTFTGAASRFEARRQLIVQGFQEDLGADYYSRSLRLHTDTAAIGITYVLRSAPATEDTPMDDLFR